jgi:hypothetical protein
MRPITVVVRHELSEHGSEVWLVQHQKVIETL